MDRQICGQREASALGSPTRRRNRVGPTVRRDFALHDAALPSRKAIIEEGLKPSTTLDRGVRLVQDCVGTA